MSPRKPFEGIIPFSEVQRQRNNSLEEIKVSKHKDEVNKLILRMRSFEGDNLALSTELEILRYNITEAMEFSAETEKEEYTKMLERLDAVWNGIKKKSIQE